MVMIVMKWLLAMLLTLVPFVFHYCIKPKAASSDKWRNFYSFLSARMPWLKRKAFAVKAWISYVYHKMYRSDNGRKMLKENSSSSESLPKEERFVINMSSELIAYLCNDYSYRNPNRFSRLKALQDLLIRFQKAKLASKDMDVNIAQLVKAWGWSRPAVLAFVDQLQKYEILEVCNMVTSKVVHLKPSIFSSGLSPTPGG